jgi:hypothetical protein
MIMIHHIIWYYYQALWLVPANAILAYRYFTRKDFNAYMVREKFDSYSDALNLFRINPYAVKVKTSSVSK